MMHSPGKIGHHQLGPLGKFLVHLQKFQLEYCNEKKPGHLTPHSLQGLQKYTYCEICLLGPHILQYCCSCNDSSCTYFYCDKNVNCSVCCRSRCLIKYLNFYSLKLNICFCILKINYVLFHILTFIKGQLISKWLLDVFDFLQKTNENLFVEEIKCFRSFFGGNRRHQKPFRN